MSQKTVLPEKLIVAHLLIQFLVDYRTCRFITIFTTGVYISTVMLSESRKESKTLWSCSGHHCKL